MLFRSLEPGDIRTVPTDDRRVYAVSGTPLNDRKREFDERMADFDRKFRELPLDAPADSLYADYNKLVPESIEANLDNLFGAYLFSVYEFDGNDIAAAKTRLKQFPAAVQAHSILQRIAEKVAATENTEIGKPYMDLTLPDAAGEPVALSGIVGKGRWVLLDFWATWCGPCCREIPHLREAYAACKSKGLEIYGVSLDNDAAKWKTFVADNDMPWINVLGVSADKRSDAAAMYGISSIPANFLISPEGIIVARDLRGENIKARLEEAMR